MFESHMQPSSNADRARIQELMAALRKIRALPTYSISQGICIDASPDRLLKADAVYRIIDDAIGSGGTKRE
jgi:hypothetical protein